MSNVGVTTCIQCNEHMPRNKKGCAWIARDTKAPHYYKLYYSETPEEQDGLYGGHDRYYCATWFEKLFNFSMEPGDEPVKVKLSLEILDE